MSKGKDLAKNTGILFIGKISTQFVSFLLLPLYTARLTKAEYGLLDLYTTIASILIPILSLQLEQAVFRYLLTNEDDEKRVLSSSALFLVFSTAVMTLIYIPVAYVISLQNAVLILLYYIATLFSTVIQQVPRGYSKYTDYTLAAFLSSTISIVFSVFFICVFHLGIDGILLARIIASLFTVIFVCLRSRLYRKISVKHFSIDCLKRMLTYSVPLVFNQLASWVVNYSDRMIIVYFLGIASNGIYAVANKFFTLITTTLNIYNLAWTESVTKTLTDDDRNAYYNHVFSLTTTLFLLAASGVTTAIGILFRFFINESYNDAYFQIPILVYAAMFSGLSANVGSFYIAYQKTVEISRTTIATAIINIITHLAMIRFIGLYAASLSTFISFFAMSIYRIYRLKDIEPLHLNMRDLLIQLPLTAFILIAYYQRILTMQIICFVFLIMFGLIVLIKDKTVKQMILQMRRKKQY